MKTEKTSFAASLGAEFSDLDDLDLSAITLQELDSIAGGANGAGRSAWLCTSSMHCDSGSHGY